MILYRDLELHECERIREMDASQYIGRAWREVDGHRQLVEIHYLDPDFPNGYDHHLLHLMQTVRSGGIALGAFRDHRLIGFCTVNMDFWGERHRYVLLDQLFVSSESRGFGVGKTLFLKAAQLSKERGAEKLYICAGSAEETIAFYHGLGCETAKEMNPKLMDEDPRDLQLEYDLSHIKGGI